MLGTKEKAPLPAKHVGLEFPLTYEDIPLNYDQPVDMSRYAPLLSADAVAEQLGFPLGDLQAVLSLPYRRSYFADTDARDQQRATPEVVGALHEDYDEMWRRREETSIFCF